MAVTILFLTNQNEIQSSEIQIVDDMLQDRNQSHTRTFTKINMWEWQPHHILVMGSHGIQGFSGPFIVCLLGRVLYRLQGHMLILHGLFDCNYHKWLEGMLFWFYDSAITRHLRPTLLFPLEHFVDWVWFEKDIDLPTFQLLPIFQVR